MSQKYKYPRTYHVPWSPGTTSDDRLLKSVDQFVGKCVVVTEKMDGENTTMSKDYVHARSLDSMYHPSRDHVSTSSHWLEQEVVVNGCKPSTPKT